MGKCGGVGSGGRRYARPCAGCEWMRRRVVGNIGSRAASSSRLSGLPQTTAILLALTATPGSLHMQRAQWDDDAHVSKAGYDQSAPIESEATERAYSLTRTGAPSPRPILSRTPAPTRLEPPSTRLAIIPRALFFQHTTTSLRIAIQTPSPPDHPVDNLTNRTSLGLLLLFATSGPTVFSLMFFLGT